MNDIINIIIAVIICIFLYISFTAVLSMEDRRQERIMHMVDRLADLAEKGHLQKSDVEKLRESLK